LKLTILAVGPTKSGPEHDLTHDYCKRFGPLASPLGLSGIDLITVKSGGGLEKEGTRLLEKVPKGAQVLRLDEHGANWSSVKFAEKLAFWRDEGGRALVFMIGGAEGYSDAVRKAYPATLAFGPQTWPHLLVRVLLAEQLYRAASILARTPYHKA
jgi:23S rRNA (pseudouridine1915-N3)-methyltransferase